jgi:hypothetical protein
MPATMFTCPDGQTVQMDWCLNVECRMGRRCLSKRTLRMIAEQRPWTGEPSTTQLLKGTREAYLEITESNYSLDPMGELFRVLGSKAHAFLEEFTDNELTEERLHDDICSGQFDFYDPETCSLVDTKTWGSYKVMKALGYRQETIETGEVFKSGARKGQAKTKKITVKAEPDMKETEIQLNDYRMKLEAAGFPVKEMFVEAIVRDGGTYMAIGRGVDKNGYLIPVKFMPDDEVREYLKAKRDALLTALETGEMPPPCTDEERWADKEGPGRKCLGFCRVARFCEYGNTVTCGEEITI